MTVNKTESWLGVIAAFVGFLSLIWMAHTALYVNNDFQVYSIMIFGSGFAVSTGIEKLTNILSLNSKEVESK